jgi:periplasmic mercuric ion binding protein
MRLPSLLVLASMAAWASCGSTQHPAVETVYETFHVEGTVERTVAEMSIQGMMCEIGCVAKVRKELLEVPGVASARIDFVKDRDLNVAVVEYDQKVVEAEALVAKVTEIGDGMYPVHRVAVTHHGEPDVRP